MTTICLESFCMMSLETDNLYSLGAYFPAQQTVIEGLVRVRGAMHETRDHACLPRCTAHSNERPITP